MVFADFPEIFASFEVHNYLRLSLISKFDWIKWNITQKDYFAIFNAFKRCTQDWCKLRGSNFEWSFHNLAESNQFHGTVPLFSCSKPFLIFLYHAINACEKSLENYWEVESAKWASILLRKGREGICESAGNCQRDTKHNNEWIKKASERLRCSIIEYRRPPHIQYNIFYANLYSGYIKRGLNLVKNNFLSEWGQRRIYMQNAGEFSTGRDAHKDTHNEVFDLFIGPVLLLFAIAPICYEKWFFASTQTESAHMNDNSETGSYCLMGNKKDHHD